MTDPKTVAAKSERTTILIRCTVERRERWHRAAEASGTNRHALAIKLLDAEADRVLGPVDSGD